jgi:hypothetical protein
MTARIRTLLPPIAGILILVVATAALGQQPPNRFDGRWATTVTCRVSKDPAGLVYKFTTEVTDSMLVGLSGTQGEPGYLLINGKISPEGIGRIYARGMTGKEEVIAGREIRAGTEYNYYIEARFEGKSGTGNRVEGRACSFKFEKR